MFEPRPRRAEARTHPERFPPRDFPTSTAKFPADVVFLVGQDARRLFLPLPHTAACVAARTAFRAPEFGFFGAINAPRQEHETNPQIACRRNYAHAVLSSSPRWAPIVTFTESFAVNPICVGSSRGRSSRDRSRTRNTYSTNNRKTTLKTAV